MSTGGEKVKIETDPHLLWEARVKGLQVTNGARHNRHRGGTAPRHSCMLDGGKKRNKKGSSEHIGGKLRRRGHVLAQKFVGEKKKEGGEQNREGLLKNLLTVRVRKGGGWRESGDDKYRQQKKWAY